MFHSYDRKRSCGEQARVKDGQIPHVSRFPSKTHSSRSMSDESLHRTPAITYSTTTLTLTCISMHSFPSEPRKTFGLQMIDIVNISHFGMLSIEPSIFWSCIATLCTCNGRYQTLLFSTDITVSLSVNRTTFIMFYALILYNM